MGVGADITTTAAAGLIAAGVVASQAADSKIQKAVNNYLSLLDTTPGFWATIGIDLTVQALSHVVNPLVAQTDVDYLYQAKQAVTAASMPVQSAIWFNRIFGLFLQPTLGPVVIYSSKEHSVRNVDVSEDPLIAQTGQDSTVYVTDNAVPRPREWTLDGYIMSLSPTDYRLTYKPTVVLQRMLLDNAAKSRLPILFKSYDMIFTKVLITSLAWEWSSDVANALHVTVSLKEFKPFTVNATLASQALALLKG